MLIDNVALPLFPGRTAALIADVGWSTPEYLPGTQPRVRLLETFLLYPSEAAWLERLGFAELRRRFLVSGVDLIDPARAPVDLAIDQVPTQKVARVSSLPMGTNTYDIPRIWADIDQWLKEKAPTTFSALKPPVGEPVIAAAETELGCALPSDLAASYRVHNGYAYLTDYEYLSLKTALAMWREQRDLPEHEPPTRAATKDKIKRVWWHPRWFPVAMDSGGNFLCVDLDPEPSGQAGQVLFWDTHEGPRVSAHESFGSWLSAFRDALHAGRFGADENGRLLDLNP